MHRDIPVVSIFNVIIFKLEDTKCQVDIIHRKDNKIQQYLYLITYTY